MLLLFVFSVSLFARSEVSASTKCNVVFANSYGKVSNDIYKNWGKTVTKGTTVTLPVLEVPGYKSYWILQTSSGKKAYAMGAKYTVTSDVKFCLFRYKLYNIRFLNEAGAEYTKLAKKLISGQTVVMPAISTNAQGVGQGWTTQKGSNVVQYKVGEKVKVTGNMNFYTIRKPVRTVKLYWPDGKLYKTVYPEGKTLYFPSAMSKTGGMILGWSRTKGKHTNPEYFTGDPLPASGNAFYMVEYRKSDDREISNSKLISPSNYGHVYIVGDSRSNMARAVVSPYVKNVTFIAKSGMGLHWLKGDSLSPERPGAYYQLVAELRKNAGKSKKKSAVVFNLGVNDLYNATAYAQFMNAMAPTLKKYNCDLYFMSVNPVNEAFYNYRYAKTGIGQVYRTEPRVTYFNNVLKSQLNSRFYKYIDSCTYLRKTGWLTWYVNGYYDGLHYTNNTTKRIYNFMMQKVEANY